jgi:hypothetical protein
MTARRLPLDGLPGESDAPRSAGRPPRNRAWDNGDEGIAATRCGATGRGQVATTFSDEQVMMTLAALAQGAERAGVVASASEAVTSTCSSTRARTSTWR